jgi:hypothetical protein
VNSWVVVRPGRAPLPSLYPMWRRRAPRRARYRAEEVSHQVDGNNDGYNKKVTAMQLPPTPHMVRASIIVATPVNVMDVLWDKFEGHRIFILGVDEGPSLTP